MKIFGKVVGCANAVFHHEHEYDSWTRAVKVKRGGCSQLRLQRVPEYKVKCCKCGWVSAWRRGRFK